MRNTNENKNKNLTLKLKNCHFKLRELAPNTSSINVKTDKCR